MKSVLAWTLMLEIKCLYQIWDPLKSSITKEFFFYDEFEFKEEGESLLITQKEKNSNFEITRRGKHVHSLQPDFNPNHYRIKYVGGFSGEIRDFYICFRESTPPIAVYSNSSFHNIEVPKNKIDLAKYPVSCEFPKKLYVIFFIKDLFWLLGGENPDHYSLWIKGKVPSKAIDYIFYDDRILTFEKSNDHYVVSLRDADISQILGNAEISIGYQVTGALLQVIAEGTLYLLVVFSNTNFYMYHISITGTFKISYISKSFELEPLKFYEKQDILSLSFEKINKSRFILYKFKTTKGSFFGVFDFTGSGIPIFHAKLNNNFSVVPMMSYKSTDIVPLIGTYEDGKTEIICPYSFDSPKCSLCGNNSYLYLQPLSYNICKSQCNHFRESGICTDCQALELSEIQNKCGYNGKTITAPEDYNVLIADVKSNCRHYYQGESLELGNTNYKFVIYDTNEVLKESQLSYSIELSQCEDALKYANNIPQNSPLIIAKLDLIPEDSNKLAKDVQFYVFSLDGDLLDLSACDSLENGIKMEIPFNPNTTKNITKVKQLLQDGINVFDKGDEFFNNLCYPYKSDDSAGMPFNVRKTLYVDAPCPENCDMENLNEKTQKFSCNCQKKKENIGKEMESSFVETILNSNFFVVRCVSRVFDLKTLKKNLGFWSFSILTLFQMLDFFYFLIDSINPVKILVFNAFTSNPPTNQDLKSQKSESTSNFLKNKKIELGIIANFCNPTVINCQRSNFRDQNYMLKEPKSSSEREMALSSSERKIEVTEKQEKCSDDLNSLSFAQAILIDKRKFFLMYWEFLKEGQPILNAFLLNEESNLKVIKISMLVLSFSTGFAFNALFFSEDIQEENYHKNGNLSFLFTLPTILFSFIAGEVITLILCLISSFYSSFKRIREKKEKNAITKAELRKDLIKFLKRTKCKIIFYFVFSMIFMIFFWYFAAAFCAVFPKNQSLWLIDSIKSLFLTMCYPVIFSFFISLFRWIGIRTKCKFFFYFSKAINIASTLTDCL